MIEKSFDLRVVRCSHGARGLCWRQVRIHVANAVFATQLRQLCDVFGGAKTRFFVSFARSEPTVGAQPTVTEPQSVAI